MHYLKATLALVVIVTSILSYGQKLPTIKKGTYVDSNGKYYHNISIPIYLTEQASTSTNTPPKLYTAFLPFKTDANAPYFFKSEGKKLVYFNGLDKSNAKLELEIFVDGKPPKSAAILTSTNKTIENNHIYYGEGLNINIESKDDYSGVNSTYVSVNSNDFQLLNGPISIQEEGDFVLNYFSVDNVGNMEPIKNIKISVDFTAPKTSLEIVGKKEGSTISNNCKVYFTAEDNFSDAINTYYTVNYGPKTQYKGGSILPPNAPDGPYHIEYYSVDKVFNKEENQSADFFLDKTSPIVTADVLGDKFIVNDKIYFSGRTKLKLTAVDNKSGVQSIHYSLDKENYIKYENPFYMPKTPGPSYIRYYAIDKLGNQGAGNPNEKYEEYTHQGGIVYVDLTGPTINYEFIGPKSKRGNTNFITKNTLVKLSGIDPESGLQKITFRYDSLNEEIDYEKPFILKGDTAGKLFFYGYDNVNNRNVNRLNYVLDSEPPIILFKFNTNSVGNKDGIEIYPLGTVLNALVADNKAGVGIGFYSLNGGNELPLKGPFTGFVPNKLYKIKVRALDKVGNEATNEVSFRIGK